MAMVQIVIVPVSFAEKDVLLIPFVEFYKIITFACEETVNVMKELRKEHKEVLRAINNQKAKTTSLLDFVNPSIIRLNEAKHMSITADEAPMSALSSPNYAE
ncbi:MAG: hypothetical protein EXX96DRAFT_537988 [Benjaminiella poitrasii]|nr:MAG: hypothetical protein EXX96DRAFT_537988 [Benjaminiella poitrasii]